jgi:radical SAM protein with 4Fe4S-binding SPASM domain
MCKIGIDAVTETKVYQKKDSFQEFHVTRGKSSPAEQTHRALRILDVFDAKGRAEIELVYLRVRDDLSQSGSAKNKFRVTSFIADEMNLLSDEDLPRYLYHRYRYDIFPSEHRLDDYPPYLQIEPSSICNFRCVFCFQTDPQFSERKSGYMGNMTLDLFKCIVDQAESHIEFLSLASRGEPLVCKAFPKMLEYSIGKFLNLKVNTNASLLTEKQCHALLCGGATTVVFSADAAEEPLYSKLRVNGSLERVLRNIEKFQKIRETEYASVPMISRVSGVLVDNDQDMSSMKRLWGGLVDQISFVKYNPWENVYQSPYSNVRTACSDLWRRMFVWYDGTVNPCDTDYKSTLSIGNIKERPLNDMWHSSRYNSVRLTHLNDKRQEVSPCNRCFVV